LNTGSDVYVSQKSRFEGGSTASGVRIWEISDLNRPSIISGVLHQSMKSYRGFRGSTNELEAFIEVLTTASLATAHQ
jgi:hypothetical protein